MAPQSRASAVLLTRPAAQSDRFARAVQARFGGVRIVSAPLLAPTHLQPDVPLRDWQGVIFTSETGVAATRRIVADGIALPRLAFCVGDRTAEAAQAAGFSSVSAQGDGAALVRLVLQQGVSGPLLYLHGAETRVDVAGMLYLAGIETVSVVCYTQTARPLTAVAVDLLHQPGAVVAPVFSARTGQILAAEYLRIGAVAPLLVVALSAEVGVEMPAADRLIAARPDQTAMLAAMQTWLA